MGGWIFLAILAPGLCSAQTWSPLASGTPNGMQPYRMRLLTDGTVMLADAEGPDWLRLTPDSAGSYISGSFSLDIAPMSTRRFSYPSEVLPNGNVWIFGGENYGPNDDSVWVANGQIWNSVSNQWTSVASFPAQTCFNITIHVDGNTTKGSHRVTGVDPSVVSIFLPGWTVSGPGIPNGATVAGIISSTSIALSIPATSTTTGSALQFSGTPTSCFGDVPTMLLTNNLILAGSLTGPGTYLYNVSTNSWSFAANKVYDDSSDEEGWTRLSDGRVITYDIGPSASSGQSVAEIYNPSSNTWSSISPSDGTASGTFPLLSSVASDYELGPSLRLLDGRIFMIGATGHTALYTPSTNSWAAGPDIIGSLNGNPALFGADDAPAALMPNGHVLLAADAGPSPYITQAATTAGSTIVTVGNTAFLYAGWQVVQTSGATVIPAGATVASVDSLTQIRLSVPATGTASGINLTIGGAYSPPTELFDFDPAANTIMPDQHLGDLEDQDPNLLGESVYNDSMLALPTGQILFSDGSYQMWVLTPAGPTPSLNYRPVVNRVSYGGSGLFTLTGLRLSGQSAGAAYGDDAEMDENYPIVRLTNSAGDVYYCRTTNWSYIGVGGGSAPQTVNFTLNPAAPPGNYVLTVSAAGITSLPFAVNITPAEVSGQ